MSIFLSFLRGIFHHQTKIMPDIVPSGEDGLQYVGHGTLLISIDGVQILTDPILKSRISGVMRRYTSPGIASETIKNVNLVIISHRHWDHYQLTSIKMLPADITVLVPKGLGSRISRAGFKNVYEIVPESIYKFGSLTISGVRTAHPSAPNAVGFIIQGSWSIYFPGDTALDEPIMREISRYYPIDVALLPIGCFRGALFGFIPISFGWIHMGPHEIERAYSFLKPKVIVPIHWGTFVIGTEPIGEAINILRDILKKVPLPVKIVSHGKWKSRDELLSQQN